MVILFCFSRAYLQGDLVLQSHCTEGLKEAKWDVIIATGAAVAGIHFSWMTGRILDGDGSDLLHAALLVAVVWPVGLLCVPTQG